MDVSCLEKKKKNWIIPVRICSDWSSEVTFSTSDSPPPVPATPMLQKAGVTTLTLGWELRPDADDEFTLQMDDRDTGHGFLPIYNGKDNSYLCVNLRRHTSYKFRVQFEAHPWTKQIVNCWHFPHLLYVTIYTTVLPNRLSWAIKFPKFITIAFIQRVLR